MVPFQTWNNKSWNQSLPRKTQSKRVNSHSDLTVTFWSCLPASPLRTSKHTHQETACESWEKQRHRNPASAMVVLHDNIFFFFFYWHAKTTINLRIHPTGASLPRSYNIGNLRCHLGERNFIILRILMKTKFALPFLFCWFLGCMTKHATAVCPSLPHKTPNTN